MTDRENITLYFEDIARRHLDIQHNPAETTLGKRRFFQMETTQQIASGQMDLMNWCLVLEGHEGRVNDNRGDHLTIQANLAFMVLKHCQPDDLAARRLTYNKAFEIGMEICAKIRTDCAAPCNAPTGAGVLVPFTLQVPKIAFHEVGQPVLVNAIGYRFTIDLYTDQHITMERNNAKWNLT